MPYSIHLLLALATLPEVKRGQAAKSGGSAEDLAAVFAAAAERLAQVAKQFRAQPVTPASSYRFEQELDKELQELGRDITQWTYNRIEPEVASLAKHVWFEASQYTRLNQKTPQNVWTLFGQIKLQRVGYRPTDKSGGVESLSCACSCGFLGSASGRRQLTPYLGLGALGQHTLIGDFPDAAQQ